MDEREQGGNRAAVGGSTPAERDARRSGSSPLRRAAARRSRRERGLSGQKPALVPGLADIAEERRRFAADVHDLVMQDLSFALAAMRSIVHEPSSAPDRAPAAAAAAERALIAARGIVNEIGDLEIEPVAARVEDAARRAARGARISVEAALPDQEHADRATADALVRIAREAVTNAIKHASADTLEVKLEHPEEWHLRVSDNGCGFEPALVDRGFGLASIRGEVEALGGRLWIRSVLERGTEIEVALP